MRVLFHRHVRHDVRAIVDFYREEAGQRLADEFFDELMDRIQQAAGHPGRFPIFNKHLRRANLRRFPYHFLYTESVSGIRVLVVRHHRRNPSFGMERK